MADKDYLKFIKSREDLISAHPAAYIKKLERIQNALYDNLLITIKGMDVKKGAALEASKLNIEMTNKLRIQMSGWLRNNGYYESITEFGKGYTGLIRESKKYYNAMGLDAAFTERDLNSLAAVRKIDLNFLMTRDRDVLNATYNEVLNSVYAGSDWRTLAERLKGMHTDTILPNGQTLRGLLKKYNATYANTAFAGFDRRIQTIKAEQYGLTKFLYSGSLIKDSRKFCADRAGKIFTKKEIDSWQNMKWPGKASGRDVWTFLGGFNCQHLLSPITDEYAKEFGNGKPEQKIKLKSDEEGALYQYTGDNFLELNKNLNKGDILTNKNQIALMDKALSKLPNYKGQVNRTINLRGMSDKAKLLFADTHKVGHIVRYDQYLSSSHKGFYGGQIGGKSRINMIINSKTAKKIDVFSKNPDEYEALFKRGSQFKVNKMTKGSFGEINIYMDEI